MTQPNASDRPQSPIQIPEIASNEPVAVIPVASVAPLEGDPGGDRINTFALAPRNDDARVREAGPDIRDRVLRNPLASMAAAFAFGFVLARVLR